MEVLGKDLCHIGKMMSEVTEVLFVKVNRRLQTCQVLALAYICCLNHVVAFHYT